MCDLVIYLRKHARLGGCTQSIMPVARISSAQFRQRAIHFVARNRAALDIDQAVRIAPEKTDYAVLRVHRDPIAICVLPRRRDDRTHGKLLQFADSLECVTHLSPFNRKLMLVIDVLIRAAAAPAEIRALWRDAIRRTL